MSEFRIDRRDLTRIRLREVSAIFMLFRLFTQMRERYFKLRHRQKLNSSLGIFHPTHTNPSTTGAVEDDDLAQTMAFAQGDPHTKHPPKSSVRLRPLSSTQENWDDDFDFGSDDEQRNDEHRQHEKDTRDAGKSVPRQTSQFGIASSASSVVENWDEELMMQGTFQKDPPTTPSPNLSRPSTSRSEAVALSPEDTFISRKITENWDDDFLDDGEEPSHNRPHVTAPSEAKTRSGDVDGAENWDADFEEPVAGPSTPRPQSADLFTSARLKGDGIIEQGPYIRNPLDRYSLDESRSELGLYARDLEDEDKTLTRRRPRHISNASPPLPMPSRVVGYNSVSPTISEFSVPRTMGESIYSHTGLLAYRSTPSISLYGAPAPSPPQRPRRRLKKKQRPGTAPTEDGGFHELQDRIVEHEEQQQPPQEVVRPSTPPPRPSTPEQTVIIEPISPASPNSRSLLSLSRVGSMKKWRRSRASTGPSEVAINEDRRPASPQRHTGSSSWFLKAVGSPDIKRFRSRDQLTVASAIGDEQTPKARIGRARSNTVGSMPAGACSVEKLSTDSKRPLSMMPTARVPTPITPMTPITPLSPAAIIRPSAPEPHRTGSVKLQKPPPPPNPGSPQRTGGYRALMGGVRRISLLGGKHKKAASKAAAEVNDKDSPEKENQPMQTESSPALLSVPPATPSEELKPAIDTSNLNTLPPSARQLSPPSSPQPASLSRVTGLGNGHAPGAAGLRRTSLGDLKIPNRIKSAQMSIKRDLNMVKEFATCMDHLKNLQTNYTHLVTTIDRGIAENANANRVGSPIRYHLPRPPSRTARNADQTAVQTLKQIEDQYSDSWEVAEVLLKLGHGDPEAGDTSFSSSIHGVAITTSDESPIRNGTSQPTVATPPSAYDRQLKWQNSTGRQAMTPRDLMIIRNILNTSNELQDLPERSTHSLAPQYPMTSTTTLPSVDPEEGDVEPPSEPKKRRGSRLRGLKGIFGFGKADDMKRQTSGSSAHPSNSSNSGLSEGHVFEGEDAADHQPHFLQAQFKQAMDTRRHPNSPYGTATAELASKSPRRPSLASIFRFGHKGHAEPPKKAKSNGVLRSMNPDDDDWDRLEAPTPSPTKSVLANSRRISSDIQPKRSPSQQQLKQHKRHVSSTQPNSSQLSINKPSTSRRPRSATTAAPPSAGVSRSGSVRVAPTPPTQSTLALNIESDPRLLFSPENIQPLLTHARKVTSELDKCIQELHTLLPQVVTVH